jgi:hypothetical protein
MPENGEISYEDVMNALKVTRTYIDQAKDKGIDVNKASELFKLARPALQNNQLDIAMDHAKKAQKEIVMESLQDTWSKILRAKEDGNDISDAKQIFSKARVTIKSEEFEKAFSLMAESLSTIREGEEEKAEKADSPTAIYQLATEKLQETFSKIKEAKDAGKNVDDAEGQFGKARDIIKTKDYEKAISICKSVIASLSLPQDQIKLEAEEMVERLAKDLKEILEFGYGTGAEKLLIREVEEFVNNAKKQMSRKNPKMAHSLAQKAETSLQQLETKFISKSTPSIILSAQSVITDAKARGVDVKYEEDILEQAQVANKEEKYILARNLAKKAEESIKSAQHKQKAFEITEELNPLKRLVQDAQAVELNTRKLERHIKNVEQALEEKKYEDAIESMNKAKDIGDGIKEKLKGQAATIAVERLRKRIKDLEEKGIEGIGEFKKGLKEAEKLLKEDKQAECVEKAEGVEKQLKEISLKEDLEQARKTLAEIQEKLDSSILPPDKKDPFVHNLEDLKKADEAEEYEKLIDETPLILEKLDQAIAEHQEKMDEMKGLVQANLDDVVELVQIMVQAEADVQDLMEDLNEAKQAFDSVDYVKTASLIEKINGNIDPKAIEKLQGLRESIAAFKMNGIDTSSIEEAFIDLQPLMTEKKYKDLFNGIAEVNKQCGEYGEQQEGLKDTIKSTLDQVQPRIQALRESGTDLTQVDQMVAQVEEAINANQFGNAQNITQQVLESLRELEEKAEFQETVDLLKETKIRLVELKDGGEDIAEAETIFQQAQPLLKEKKYSEVKEVIGQVLDIIDKAPEDAEVTTLQNEIDQLREITSGLKEQGQDVMDPENHLLQAEESVKNQELLWAKEYLNKAREEIVELGGEVPAPPEEEPAPPEPPAEEIPPEAAPPEPPAEEPPPEPPTEEPSTPEAPPEDPPTDREEADASLGPEEQVPPGEPATPEAPPEETPPEPPADEGGLSPQDVIDELTQTRQNILAAKGEGKDITEAEELFKKAEPLLRDKNLVGCMEVVNQINATLADLPTKPPAPPPAEPPAAGGGTDEEKKATCQEAIDSIESVIGEFDKIGANTQKLEEMLNNAKSSLDAGEFDKALEFATKGIEEIENIQGIIPAMEELKTLEEVIKEAKEMGADVDRAFALYVDAQDAVSNNDVDNAKNLIARAMDLAESARNIAKVLVTMPGQDEEGGEEGEKKE